MIQPYRTALALAATLGALACGAPPENATSPTPVASAPTPRPAPRPALIVATTERSYAQKATPTSLALYVIGADGRLTLAGPPQPIGDLSAVHAGSYAASSGLYRQLVADGPGSTGGRLRLATYRPDLETGVFTPLGAQDAPFASSVVAFHPNGRAVYASVGTGQLDGYELDPGNGALLRRLPGAPYSWDAPVAVSRLAFAPSGRFAWGTGRVPDGYHHNHGFVLTFGIDPATGAVAATAETPLYDQQSDLAVATGEDTAYIVDRSDLRAGELTWHRFRVDGSGALDREERWNARLGGPVLRFTRSDRSLLGLEGRWLDLMPIGAGGRPAQRATADAPRSEYWDARRVLLQVGDHVYVGGDRTIGVLRLDEDAGTLEPVQEVTAGETLEILAVTAALPPS